MCYKNKGYKRCSAESQNKIAQNRRKKRKKEKTDGHLHTKRQKKKESLSDVQWSRMSRASVLPKFLIVVIQFIKTVPFKTIQFSISAQFNFNWPVDRTLSGATTLGQSGPGSDGNEGVLLISQSSSITGTTPSDCLVSYPGDAIGVFYRPSRLGQLKEKSNFISVDQINLK